jgi:micrococcal nuclease|tara:strand:- start:20 stop:436 length:417 start_codon:yes stop_codon:yes gene_type:complete
MRLLTLLLITTSLVSADDHFDFQPYTYKAEVLSVYDADTVTLNIDLGLNVHTKQKLRLYGINAPEVRGVERTEGLKSRNALREWIPVGSTLIVRTHKDKQGKYGRYVGTLYRKNSKGRLVDLNKQLVQQGYAKFHDYD